MGIAVYIENQLHERKRQDKEVADWLNQLRDAAPPDGQISVVSEYGDTMLNILQLRRVLREIEEIASGDSEIQAAAAGMTRVINEAIRLRGYLWVSGD